MEYLRRIKILQASLQAEQVFLLSKPADVQYYSGLINLNPEERESFLVVSSSKAILMYPSFSPLEKHEGFEYHAGYWPNDLAEVVGGLVAKEKIAEVFLDKSSLFLHEFEAIQNLKVQFSSLNREIIWQQRMAKDVEELALLERAGQITAQVMNVVIKTLKAGMTEAELAQQIEIEMRKLGAETVAFPPVVAFGKHSALPHHQPTDTQLENNMVVLIDIGAKYHGYCGDMTRTVWFGDAPSEKFVEIEKVVKDAYDAAMQETHAENSGAAIDKAVRRVIKKAGYEKHFIHTTGHGVGLEIHEQPSLYFKKDAPIPQGSVITIEPGIYLEGQFGYRHENMVLVENESSKELT